MPSATSEVPALTSRPASPSGGALIEEAATVCRARYGADPEITILAPGRVNLIGEHVDYNEGFVFPMAIDRYVVLAAIPSDNGDATVFSAAQDAEVTVALDAAITRAKPAWSNYVRGVLAGFQHRGQALPGFRAVVLADLPLGGGLSSSAALEVGTCRLVEALTGQTLPDLERVLLCQKAEHDFAGVPCGIMDQFIVANARRHHALLLDCRSLEARHIPLDSEVAVLVSHSGVAHELGKGEYAARRADCNRAVSGLGVASLRAVTLAQLEAAADRVDTTAFRRARHVVTEIDRAQAFAGALEARDWSTAGEAMYESHRSLREDYEVSCAELDQLVEIARSLGESRGVYGSRLTGAGFGGCTVTLVRQSEAETVRRALVEQYRERTGIVARSFLSVPAAGARRV